LRVGDRSVQGPRLSTDDEVRAYLRKSKISLDAAMEGELNRVLGAVAVDGAVMANLNEGKKIRGCLTCLVGEALGASPEVLPQRAVAVEFIQAASLIHDDYVDQDRLRRNKPALWTVAGARRAVLIGDVIFASAIGAMSELSREDGSVVSQAIALMSKGALHELIDPRDLSALVGSGDLSAGFYGRIIRLKTGILFGAACELGAIAAGAEESVRESVRNYGTDVGKAYQIADDLGDIKRRLTTCHIGREDIPTLVPVFASFAPEMIPYVLDRSRGVGTIEVGETVARLMRGAVGSMEKAVEGLLESAVSRLEDGLPPGAATEMLFRAPWVVIDMFKESEAREVSDRTRAP
jgi:geranylgeranyl pyrophosphate synthase